MNKLGCIHLILENFSYGDSQNSPVSSGKKANTFVIDGAVFVI
jgi:hypothetical protein